MIQDINNMCTRFGHDFYKHSLTVGSNAWDERSNTLTGSTLIRGIIEHIDYERAELMPEGMRNPDDLTLTFQADGSLYNNDFITWEGKDYMITGKKEIHFLGSVVGYKAFLVRDFDI
jgi:hypothetical protein